MGIINNMRSASRSDVLMTDNPQLSREIAAKERAEKRGGGRRPREDKKRMMMRKKFVENQDADPNGLERVLGESDLTGINFLARGLQVAAAVCRIKLPSEGGPCYGTGFLVGPRLLMTNNHVLSSPREAAQAEAEFGYEHDLDGVLSSPVQFNLNPEEVFYTNSDLDVTFVAVSAFAENNTPLERFGRLPLLPVSGKAVGGEWVSIVQHPNGQPKQIAIRSSEIIEVDEAKFPELRDFIHYSTDTEPGSSGSPVFNDQWQVVAIHHKAVPAPEPPKKNTKGSKRQTIDEEGGGEVKWIANEGVRISAIFQHLTERRFQNDDANEVMNRLAAALGIQPTELPAGSLREVVEHEQHKPFAPTRWEASDLGYKEDFHEVDGERVVISLDTICKEARKAKLTVPLKDGSGDELKYKHFSVVMHEKRKFALITAVNIEGVRLEKVERKDTWRRDDRIADEYQPDDEFYVKTRQKEKVYFSRGHLVRLLDPSWGSKTEAQRGQEDTFHFTNAAPQVQSYNDTDWGNLEDYLLDKAQISEKRLTIFTGPIYRDSDPEYGDKRKGGPWQIPQSYWKVAVLQKSSKKLAVAAFIVGQTEEVKALYEAKVFTGLRPYTIEELRTRQIQVTLAALERELGENSKLDFSALKKWDAIGSLESTRQVCWLRSAADVQI